MSDFKKRDLLLGLILQDTLLQEAQVPNTPNTDPASANQYGDPLQARLPDSRSNPSANIPIPDEGGTLETD